MDDDLLRVFDRDARIDWVAPEAKREELRSETGKLLLVRFVRPPPAMSAVLYSDLDGLPSARRERMIADEAEAARRRGLALTWTLYAHDRPTDLHELLERHGFQSEDEPGDLGPVMVLPVTEVAPRLLAPIGPDVRAVGAEELAHVVSIEERVWGGDFGWLETRLRGHFAEPGLLSVHVAYVDGEPACAGWSYHHPAGRFVMLRGGSTVPEHRRTGLYAVVLASRVQEAVRRGALHLVVEPSPMNVPIVSKFGFRELTRARDFELRT